MKIKDSLCFDDVLLIPQHSNIESRSNVDTSVKLGKLLFKHPIIPANMVNVTGKEMAKCIADSGGMALLHRFMPIEQQLEIARYFSIDATYENKYNYMHHVGFSIGVKLENRNDIDALVADGAEILCIDIAHGDSKLCIDTISYIKDKFPEIFLIAGNVATGEGAARLWKAGADIIKAGVGSGSICSTRIKTGNGVPQLSALIDIAEIRSDLELASHYSGDNKKFYIISDGGIRDSGDIVKSLCFSDMVMCGNIFAGCNEAPGDIVSIDNVKYKEYAGSSTYKNNYIEGVKSLVPCKGSYESILNRLLDGLRSGMSYQGVDNLIDLRDCPQFTKITNAGLKESNIHDVREIK